MKIYLPGHNLILFVIENEFIDAAIYFFDLRLSFFQSSVTAHRPIKRRKKNPASTGSCKCRITWERYAETMLMGGAYHV